MSMILSSKKACWVTNSLDGLAKMHPQDREAQTELCRGTDKWRQSRSLSFS